MEHFMKLTFKYRIFFAGSMVIAIYLMHGLTQYSLKIFTRNNEQKNVNKINTTG